MSSTIYPMIEAERREFARYLGTLAADDWEKPSLCTEWTVKDVAAHVVAGARSTPLKFIGGLVGAGFNFNRAMDKQLRAELHHSPQELVAALDQAAPLRTKPARGMLGEVVIHNEDVRRALGAPAGEHSPEALRVVADIYVSAGPPVRSKKRTAGLRFRATDMDWSWGEGPEVSGPIVSLLLAMTGRPAGLSDLSGAGLPALSARM